MVNVSFKTLFFWSAILCALVMAGPAGGTVLGALVCVFFFTGGVVRFVVGAILVFTIAIPALVVAGILHAINQTIFNLIEAADAEKIEPQAKTPGIQLIDAEYTIVKE